MATELSRRSLLFAAGGAGALIAAKTASAGLTSLKASPGIRTSHYNQVVESLDIVASGTAITVGHDNVTIRNCRIGHDGGRGPGYGILANSCYGLAIEDCEIYNIAAPAAGAAANERQHNVRLNKCDMPSIRRIKLRDGSTGVYLDGCSEAWLSMVEGFNMRGPFPRGQLVQFSNCKGGTLEDFYCLNDPAISWPEDIVSVYRSPNVLIRRGLLDGCNARSGVGVMVEQKESMDVIVEDVDVTRMFNGSFSAATGAVGTTFRRCRTRDGMSASIRVSGRPPSNYLMFASWGNSRDTNFGGIGTAHTRLESCVWFNMPNPTNVAWEKGRFAKLDIQQSDFVLRSPVMNKFVW